MKAFTVVDVRPFMKALLTDPLFASWQFRKAELKVMSYITVDGQINPDYLTEEEKTARTSPYLTWEEIQPRIRALIQGTHTPTLMNITLAMEPSKFRGMPTEQVESLLLNIRYETVSETAGVHAPGSSASSASGPASSGSADGKNGKTQQLTLITGVSFKTFSLDKTPERLWDEAIPAYFKAHGLPLTEA